MILFGLILALLVGLSLGLVGSGGSILTLPILVYVLEIHPVLATGYSLFIVGMTALVGALYKAYKKEISYKTIFLFGLPSIITVYVTRLFVLPVIPKQLDLLGASVLLDTVIMMLFSVLVLASAVAMIKGHRIEKTKEHSKLYKTAVTIIEGIVVGFITGFVGAGGGFLIVPILVLMAGLSMNIAIGTSLGIIAIKSLAGFVGDIQAGIQADWSFLLLFTGLSIIGIILGGFVTRYINTKDLQKGFGVFLIFVAVYTIGVEATKLFTTQNTPEQGTVPVALVSKTEAAQEVDTEETTQVLPGPLVTVQSSGLSESEIQGLILMREEEKLARDVYAKLGEMWGTKIFFNISASEQTHTNAVAGLLEQYGIPDPVVQDVPGVFANPDMQALYDSFVARGSGSLQDALKVGADIEILDIKDLEKLILQTDEADIIRVYENLKRGSENHLRAFNRQM